MLKAFCIVIICTQPHKEHAYARVRSLACSKFMLLIQHLHMATLEQISLV